MHRAKRRRRRGARLCDQSLETSATVHYSSSDFPIQRFMGCTLDRFVDVACQVNQSWQSLLLDVSCG